MIALPFLHFHYPCPDSSPISWLKHSYTGVLMSPCQGRSPTWIDICFHHPAHLKRGLSGVSITRPEQCSITVVVVVFIVLQQDRNYNLQHTIQYCSNFATSWPQLTIAPAHLQYTVIVQEVTHLIMSVALHTLCSIAVQHRIALKSECVIQKESDQLYKLKSNAACNIY